MEPHYTHTKTEKDTAEQNETNTTLTSTLINIENKTAIQIVPSISATCLIASQSSPGNVEGVRRSNTSIEGKYRCAVTSERLAQLRKMVETAIREHKVFTIKGTQKNTAL